MEAGNGMVELTQYEVGRGILTTEGRGQGDGGCEKEQPQTCKKNAFRKPDFLNIDKKMTFKTFMMMI